ncbi:MAG: acyltransferase [Phycisphaerales bacterium]|nr:MAG: acyltransferase [Phycisphaerales bacterium]
MNETAPSTPRGDHRDRDDSIDVLRVIGLLLIMLAHTIPSSWLLFQLRTFDVPLMVIVSGMAFCVSSPPALRLGSYYWKRILRLVLPTYVFLTLFFLITALCFCLSDQASPFKGRLVGTFTLRNVNSIGYVWIIRVFLLVALTAPFLHALWRRVHPALFGAILVVAYIFYEIVFQRVPRLEPSWLNTFVTIYVYFAISYTVVFGVGMLLIRLGVYPRLALAVVLGIAFAVCVYVMSRGDTIQLRMQSFKYPPRIYYVSWGLFMSTVLSLVFMKVRLGGTVRSVVQFLSSVSLWIYLWHIVVLSVMSWHIDVVPFLRNPWLKFVTVVVVSSLLAYGHRALFKMIAGRLSRYPTAKKLVSQTFLK